MKYAQHYKDITDAKIKPASSTGFVADLMGNGTDWQDRVVSKGSHDQPQREHELVVTRISPTAISAGYLDQDGIAIGSGFKRQTLRGNIDAQIKKWLKGGINFSLADSKQETSYTYNIIMTALTSQPSVAVRNPEGGYDGPDDQWMQDNPVALAEITDNHNKRPTSESTPIWKPPLSRA